MIDAFEGLCQNIRSIPRIQPIGRVTNVTDSLIYVSGLQADAKLGDVVRIETNNAAIEGEVLGLDTAGVKVCPDVLPDTVRLGDIVKLRGPKSISPSLAWLGRVVDANGNALDGGRPLARGGLRAIKMPPPPAVDRRGFGAQLRTPFAVFNTVLPLAQGQRVGLFAGSGVGKSTLLGGLAKGVSADVNVIALIGERGREVNEFINDVLGAHGLAKSVVVVATSDQSAALRRRAAYTAMTIAEAFRDEGRNVLFLADSLTRFAEAHRQIAVAGGEAANLRGYPASTATQIMQLCERAGPGVQHQGDITGIFSVLVAGSNMEEPIADITRGVLDGHIVLDRKIAERGRFPAIDVSLSVSRSVLQLLSTSQKSCISHMRELLGSYEASEVMIRAGLYAAGQDTLLDKAVRLWPQIDRFVARASDGAIEQDFKVLSDCVELPAPPSPSDEG